MKSEVRCGSVGAEFGCLVVLFVSSGSALIRSHSLVSRSSISGNYTSLSLFVLSGFAFLFLFWLGSAIDHQRAHTHYYPFSVPLLFSWSLGFFGLNFELRAKFAVPLFSFERRISLSSKVFVSSLSVGSFSFSRTSWLRMAR